MKPPRVLLVLGTRPEVIKLAPVAAALDGAGVPVVTVATGQHGPIAHQAMAGLGLAVSHDLAVHRPGQTLTDVTTAVLTGITAILAIERPDVVMVQGDTTSALAAGLAGFYSSTPVVHLEAGLRSGNVRSPWPEEANRRLLTPLVDLHLAPTQLAKSQLLAERVPPADIVVTGNTVVDALHQMVAEDAPYAEPGLCFLDEDPRRAVLITAHRRESWGEGIRGIGEAVLHLARHHPDVVLVFPLHPNPGVRACLPPELSDQGNVHLLEPLGYGDLIRLLARCHLVITDSGGLQEEAPSLGVPVLVTREVTERTEAVAAGCAVVVGARTHAIVSQAERLLADADAHRAMSTTGNPFGDGRAAERVVASLLHRYAGGPTPTQFAPQQAIVPGQRAAGASPAEV